MTVKSSFIRNLCVASILLLWLPATLRALNPEAELRAAIEGTTLLLKHFYTGNHQNYDLNGELKGNKETGHWAVFSHIFIQKAKLNEHSIHLEAYRVYVGFSQDKKNDHRLKSQTEVILDIAIPDHAGIPELVVATNRIFLNNKENLGDYVPEDWKPHFLSASDGPAARNIPEIELGYPVARGNPIYPLDAEQKHEQGSVVIFVVIGKNGKVDSASVLRSAGGSLDASSLQAVRGWVYKPFLADGKPIEVTTQITVNFNLSP